MPNASHAVNRGVNQFVCNGLCIGNALVLQCASRLWTRNNRLELAHGIAEHGTCIIHHKVLSCYLFLSYRHGETNRYPAGNHHHYHWQTTPNHCAEHSEDSEDPIG
jgi:hypothetical protein